MTDLSKPPRPDEIRRSLASALREGRHESVPHLLALLSRTSPSDAEVVYGGMLAVLEGGVVVAQGSLFGLPAAS